MISLMRLALWIYFLTLVVSVAGAAPDTSVKPDQISPKDPGISAKGPVEKEATQVSASSQGPTKRLIWKPVRASNNWGIGLASGALDTTASDRMLTSFHFQRTQYNLDDGAQEFGLGLIGTNFLTADLGYKQGCCFSTWAQTWDPFYKLGLAGVFDPKDQLGNIIDYKRYFLQVGGGFESLFESRRNWRLEAGARFGYAGFHYYAQIYLGFPD